MRAYRGVCSARGGPLHAAILALALGLALAPPQLAAEDAASVERGEYLFHAAGCGDCHTDVKNQGPPLAGGRAIETPFGTFYGPNITPDPEHGIGGWSDADFIRALREGRAPDGSHYYPAFPYTSFTRMTDRDMLDLKAYLFSQPPVARPDRPHELNFPFGWRFLIGFWKWLYFEPGPMPDDPARPAQLNRGEYLVRALAHCSECHTPRDVLGGPKSEMFLAGSSDIPEGVAPNITPDPETGIGEWSRDDILFLLQIGLTPEGDVVGGLMGEVVQDGTGKLTSEDREAIAEFLQSLPPIRNRVERKKPAS